jgi:type IV pilus assembly protein PilQ
MSGMVLRGPSRIFRLSSSRWIGAFIALTLITPVFGSVKITSVDFKGSSDPSEITIKGDGDLNFEKIENSADKQLILEIKDAKIGKGEAQKIDTSSFDSKVSQISPYQVKGQDTVRVVVQLREMVSTDVSQDKGMITIKVPNSGGTEIGLDSPPEKTADAKSGDSSGSAAFSSGSDVSAAEDSSGSASSSKTDLDTFMASKDNKKFIGKHVTLQIRDGDVADVLRLISEASGFNIVLGESVRGKMNLSLVDVPWDQALDIVMRSLRLGAERNNNVLRIDTLQNLAAEKTDELAAQKAAAAVAPRVTRLFPINYADPKELQKTLDKFVTGNTATAAAPAAAGTPAAAAAGPAMSDAVVQIDDRTNSIIVRDTNDNLEKMQKLIELLDVPSPQVLIEAKIVEASDRFAKSLSGSLGIGGGGQTGFGSFAGGNPFDALLGSPGVFADGASIAGTTATLGTVGYSPSLSFLPGIGRINAILSWGENESQLKVIAAPKTVVLNKLSASIVQGTPVLIPGQTVSQTGSPVPLTTVQQANISLKVKPTVTNDGNIQMELTVTKDVPESLGGGNQGVGNRSMTTTVMVETGTTLVIGGIYNLQTTRASAGFPILRKLPLIGALFGSEDESTNRSELFIFVTPKILNAREMDRSA